MITLFKSLFGVCASICVGAEEGGRWGGWNLLIIDSITYIVKSMMWIIGKMRANHRPRVWKASDSQPLRLNSPYDVEVIPRPRKPWHRKYNEVFVPTSQWPYVHRGEGQVWKDRIDCRLHWVLVIHEISLSFSIFVVAKTPEREDRSLVAETRRSCLYVSLVIKTLAFIIITVSD